MEFLLFIQNILELWKEWEMRLLVLLSLFLQLALATQASKRKYKFRIWIYVMVWTAYTLADSITSIALGIFSNRLANIKGTKGTIDPKTQITAFWAPFLLLHLGGPDTITAFVNEDNELWLRQFLRLCIQAGLVGFIYYMALSGSTLSMLAVAMILVGLMKYAERILCLYLASKGKLRESMLSLPDSVPIYHTIREQCTLKEEEGYQVEIDEVCEVLAREDFPRNTDQASEKETDATLLQAYEMFKVFKFLFLGLIRSSVDLEASKRMFVNPRDMDPGTAFGIVEIERGFMYDLLYTKAPLLNCAWGIIRWAISLSVPGAMLVFFSLQDKKDYAKVDVCITFLLISVAILLEIYSLLLAISSDWVHHWLLQRPRRSTISSAVAFLQFCPNQRWSTSVAQISLLKLSTRKLNRIFLKWLIPAKLDEKLVIFDIAYEDLENSIKEQIFYNMKDTVRDLERNNGLKSFRQVVCQMLSNKGQLSWSVEEKEFDQSILIWHIATELCYYKDRDKRQGKSPEQVTVWKMSKLVSQYMLYLLVLYPSMLPAGIGVLRYRDTLVEAQEFFKGEQAKMSNEESRINSSVVKTWAQNLFKKAKHGHSRVKSCNKAHKSTESRDLCELCPRLLQVGTQQPATKLRSGKSRSVLSDACHLAYQLNKIEFSSKWKLIGKVWPKFLIFVACQSKDHEHCGSLSRGGELLTNIWLLMAHYGIAEAVEISNPPRPAKLVIS